VRQYGSPVRSAGVKKGAQNNNRRNHRSPAPEPNNHALLEYYAVPTELYDFLISFFQALTCPAKIFPPYGSLFEKSAL